ncbi:MAG: hypothetical protein ACLUSL_11570 [Ruminococcus sp.]
MVRAFSVLMTGMTLMSDSVGPLAESEQFSSLLTALPESADGRFWSVRFLPVLSRDSAASVGILQALSLTGQVTYGMAIPIIMGQNIGTCVTALMSSNRANKNAEDDVCSRCISALTVSVSDPFCRVFLIFCHWIFQFGFVATAIDPAGVALGTHDIQHCDNCAASSLYQAAGKDGVPADS